MGTAVISGTKEWAVASVNCVTGCEHNCRYCYARYNAVERWHLLQEDEWAQKKVRLYDVKKKRYKYDGTVMFPTTHDICPEVLDDCVKVLKNLLEVGNDVLIVSKPHLDCIIVLCKELAEYKDHILFRFTIGSMNDDILKYWEPGAPSFEERFGSLKVAFEAGFKTSVSCEPMLDSDNVVEMFHVLDPFITDSIWIGKLNHVERRVKIETDEDKMRVAVIVDGQTDQRIREIYDALKNEKHVKWKESFKSVLGLELATEAGMDV